MIIFEDDDILVINKPAGLLTVPDGYNPSLPSVKSILEAKHKKVWIVHRLDKETSGILIVAKNAISHKSLNAHFAQRKITKTYHAFVAGTPSWSWINITIPLKINGDRKHRTVPDCSEGKNAETRVVVMFLLGRLSLIEVCPKTGYTHQIRSHLASIGFPIMGDRLYGTALSNNIVTESQNYLFLHAFSINFIHPLTLKPVSFTAPYPAYWQPFLAQIKNFEF